MSRFRLILRTIICAIRLLPIVLCVVLPAIILMVILSDESRYKSTTLYRFLDWTYRGILWAIMLPVEYVGNYRSPETPAIFIANHQSALDIPLVGVVLNGHSHVWLAHEWYLRYPILGTFIRRIGVAVRPGDAEKGISTVRSSMSHLRNGDRSIIIFPEGTRHRDGSVHDFRGGFGILAQTTGLPVVPILIEHAGEALPPKSLLVKPICCRVTVGEPYEVRAQESNEEFIARIRAWYHTHAQ